MAPDDSLVSPYALPFVVALTGHRDLHADDVPVVATQLFEAIQLIAAALPHTPIQFLSALADGADQLFAEQVLTLQRQYAALGQQRIELVVPLPLPFEEYCIEQAGGVCARQRDPLQFEADRQAFCARFLRCSAGASKVFVLPPTAPVGVLVAVQSPEQSPAQAAYAQLTRYLGIHAQLLIAVWDGQSESATHPRRPGGTLDLVQMLLHGVERSGHPRSSNRFAEPAHGTVLHIYTRRARASSDALASAQAYGGFRLAHGAAGDSVDYWDAPSTDWPGVCAPTLWQCVRSPVRACERWAAHRRWRALVAQVESRLGQRCPPRALAVLYQVHADGREIDTLNLLHQRALAAHDSASYTARLSATAQGFLASLTLPDVAALPAALGLGLGPLLRTFCVVDVQAERSKRYWSYRWRFLTSAAVLAAASSSLRLLSPSHGDLLESLAFTVGACCAVATYLWVALSPQRHAYLDYRALAEGLRFQMYWWCAGEPARVTDHFVQKYSGEIGWVRHALDASLVVHPVSGLEARRVVRGWIADQLGYLNGNGNRRRRHRHVRSVAVGNDLLLTGLVCALASLTLVLASGHRFGSLLALLLAGMKLATGVGAAWLSFNTKMGHGETLAQGDQLRGLYRRAAVALDKIESGAGAAAEQERHARDLLFALGKAVLEENAGWLAAHQQRRLSWHGR